MQDLVTMWRQLQRIAQLITRYKFTLDVEISQGYSGYVEEGDRNRNAPALAAVSWICGKKRPENGASYLVGVEGGRGQR